MYLKSLSKWHACIVIKIHVSAQLGFNSQPFPDFVSQAEGSAQPPIHLTNTSTQDNYAMLYSGHFCPPFLCPVPLNTMTFEDMFISSY